MALLHPLFDILPKVLVDEIFSYDPKHREYMKEVFEELKDKLEFRYKCDRYDCTGYATRWILLKEKIKLDWI
jgi:hypothetical protein